MLSLQHVNIAVQPAVQKFLVDGSEAERNGRIRSLDKTFNISVLSVT